eukprot:12153032-Ditylum_brightwellii.AAC.1
MLSIATAAAMLSAAEKTLTEYKGPGKGLPSALDAAKIREWLSRATLVPKPHQEVVTSIKNFLWHFCVNYIPLNHIMHLITYPIPRCNDAVSIAFGKAILYILLDVFYGYQQIKMEIISSIKTAFAGSFGCEYHYKVMSFDLVNAP